MTDSDPRPSQTLEGARNRLADLRARAQQSDADPMLCDAVEELGQTLEELSVALEELEASTEELSDSRLEVERQARRYFELFQHAPDAYLATDTRGIIRDVNRRAEEELGRPGRYLRGKPLVALVAESDRDDFLDFLAALQQGRGQLEMRLLRFGVGFDAAVSALTESGHDGVEIRWVLRNVSELRERDAFRDQIESELDSVVWLYQLDPTSALHVSQAYERVAGRPVSELRENPRVWVEHVHPDDRPRVEAALEGLVEGKPFDIEFRLQRPDGTLRWLRDRGWPLRDGRGALNRAAGITEDVTERRRVQRELAKAERQRRAAAFATERAEARERRALARDLHDSVNQSLALARTKLVALRDATDGTTRASLMRDIEALVAEADAQTRSLSFRLSPPVLHDLGLVAAAEWLADDLGHLFGLRTTVTDEGLREPLPEMTREALFRSLRELLVNVARHAGTDEARVSLASEGDLAAIFVEDGGSGFEPTSDGLGFGLVSIRERMEALGGRLQIESEPGRGTRARLLVPVSEPT